MSSNSKYRFLIPPVIVLFLLIIVFIINGVYPFGNNTIVNGDFGKAYVPVYYYIYDVLMGNANIFMNFKVGMGSNMFDLTSVYGILSPLSWLIILSSRSNIPNFLSFMLIIKLCLCSVTTFILFDKIYKKIELFWKVLFSVFYALGFYIIVYHTNFVWLDNIILFPILLLGFKNIVDKNDFKLYTFILFLSFSFSFYISYMEMLFILFLSVGYLVFLCDKEKRKKFILSLGIGTFIGIGMSALFVWPVVLQTLASSRMVETSFNLNLFNNTLPKLLVVCGFGLPIILFVIMLFSKKCNKNIKRFFLFMFAILCIGVILEPINLMWHTGSYKLFPFRYGFIPVMIIYLGALYYLNKNPDLSFKCDFDFKPFIFILFIGLVVAFYFFIPVSADANPSVGISDNLQAGLITLILLLSFFLNIYILLLKDTILKKRLICLFFLICSVGFSLGYIGISSSDLNRDDTDDYLEEANDLYEFLKDDDNDFNRYKNLDNNLINNYAFITNTSSIASWKMVDGNAAVSLRKLGYVVTDSLHERDGSLFSDNLLGITKYVSSKELDSRLFKLLYDNEDLKLYELNNSMGYGFLYDHFEEDESGLDYIAYQNYVYRSLFNKKDNILESANVFRDDNSYSSNICVDKDMEVNFYVKVNELGQLYFKFGNITEVIKIKVNDIPLNNGDVVDLDRDYFDLSNGIVNLGLYENETVKVSISLDEGNCLYNYDFSILKIDKLNNLVEDNKSDVKIKQKDNSIVINVNNDKNKDSLFLPLNYLNGYKGELNGKEIKVNKVLNNFVSIDLEDGDNEIVLTYYPPGLKICLFVSIISIILFILSFIFKFNCNSKILLNLATIIYYLVVVLIFFIVYIYGFIRLF